MLPASSVPFEDTDERREDNPLPSARLAKGIEGGARASPLVDPAGEGGRRVMSVGMEGELGADDRRSEYRELEGIARDAKERSLERR
jgi:hypothetical protein